MEIPFKSFHKSPFSFRSEATFQGMKIIQGFDGEKGWSINPMTGSKDPQPLTDEQNDRMKIQADYAGLFYNYKDKGYKVEYLGTDDEDDLETYKIKLTRPSGDEITAFIDKDNYVMIKTKFKTIVQGVAREAESFFSNYKTVDGILEPYDIETKFGGKTVSHIIVDRIEYGVNIPDSLFQMPKVNAVEDTAKEK